LHRVLGVINTPDLRPALPDSRVPVSHSQTLLQLCPTASCHPRPTHLFSVRSAHFHAVFHAVAAVSRTLRVLVLLFISFFPSLDGRCDRGFFQCIHMSPPPLPPLLLLQRLPAPDAPVAADDGVVVVVAAAAAAAAPLGVWRPINSASMQLLVDAAAHPPRNWFFIRERPSANSWRTTPQRRAARRRISMHYSPATTRPCVGGGGGLQSTDDPPRIDRFLLLRPARHSPSSGPMTFPLPQRGCLHLCLINASINTPRRRDPSQSNSGWRPNCRPIACL